MSNDVGSKNSGLKSIAPKGGFEKPKLNVTMHEKKITGSSDAHGELKTLGEKLGNRTPQISAHHYVGSIAIHFYVGNDLNPTPIVLTQQCLGENIDPVLVNYGLSKASVDVARDFGWTPSKKQQSIIKEL